MNVRHVQFPCGRCGLEVEHKHYGGSEITPSYAYFYNGFGYFDIAANEKPEPIQVKRDYYGRIEGLTVLRDKVDVDALVCFASTDWTGQ